MNYNGIIVIPKKAGLSYKSIIGATKHYKRSGMTISETGSTLKITIKTNDAAAMRASLNAIMRDIQVIEGASAV
jgi:tRNA threonylcarbamoyladenosine modification (KEOPS) complex  Pcc1 subunit